MNQPLNIKDLSFYLKEGVDLFICSSSFEERCFTLAKEVAKDFNPKKSLVFYNENEYQKIIENAKKLGDTLNVNSDDIIPLNSDKQIHNAIKINEELDLKLKENIDTILLDTTTFTHETLLVLFRLLFFKKSCFKNLFISYVGADDYSFNELELSKKWLSKGISEIRTIMGYPGVMSPARDNHLVVLFGFERDRTNSLIDHLQFEKVSLGFGAKTNSISSKHYNLNYERHCELMKKYTNASKFELDLTDPYKAKEDIENYLSNFFEDNIVIAPMNNKLSTIGASLVAIANQRVQLIYAKAIEYNAIGYSKPMDTAYLFKIW